MILEGVEKVIYQCTWKYSFGDQRARETYLRFVKEMRRRIGDILEKRTDKPVKHPDFFASYYFLFVRGEASVAFKNKSKLMSTLVTIGVDGFKQAK